MKRGRKAITKELRELVIQIAKEELRPSARNVANQLENLGFIIKREKVRQILNEENIKPDTPEPDENIIKARNGELNGKIVTKQKLNGLIRFRYREAA